MDDQSIVQAKRLTADLQKAHLSIVEANSQEIMDAFRSEPTPGTTITKFSNPLHEVANEIPLPDVEIDVREFGVVVALARRNDRQIVAMPMGTEYTAVLVPVLPARGLLRAILRLGDPNRSLDTLQSYFAAIGMTAKLVQIPIQKAQEMFFHGLFTYLSARIAGVRWSRSQTKQPPPGGGGAGIGGGGGGGTPGGPGGGGGMGQWWTVNTQSSGLSMYYAGTHAVRYPPNYLGGLTTPLPIYLSMGTFYLGADAGPSGIVIWDPSVVTVPSNTPTFNTKVF